jgi:hypothetical protein
MSLGAQVIWPYSLDVDGGLLGRPAGVTVAQTKIMTEATSWRTRQGRSVAGPPHSFHDSFHGIQA